MITHVITEPDEIFVRFVESDIFMDRRDFSVLSNNVTISAKLPP